MGGAMKAMKLGMIWVLVGMGLAVLLSVGVLGSAQSARALDSTDPILVGAGDIASCTSGKDEATASLLEGINGTVATLGDNAYDSGTASEYANCYDNYKLTDPGTLFDSSRPAWWGEFKARTMPSVGNHEYYTAGASGYFGYFKDAASPTEPGCTVNCKGYYSYPLGSWHVVVLNSNCAEVGGCGAGSPQEVWLRNDLRTHPSACTLAYFHHPRFSSSGIGNNSAMAPFWKALYDDGAEVVLNGHAHNYERFAPQTPDGQAKPDYGIREFVVGTGGKSLNKFVDPPQNNSEVRLTDNSVPPGNFGVIKLTLHPASYDWEFRTIDGTVDGTVADSGSATCHGAPTSTTDRPGPPSITTTDPATNATGVATTTNVTATFSEEMTSNTINTKTFKLFKKGTTTKISSSVSYDANTDMATLDPTNSLQGGTTYKAVVTTGATDSVGNPLPQQYKWFFTTG
jgi:Bacterial Ig-like domain/Calcineurin-like phosphoesterase